MQNEVNDFYRKSGELPFGEVFIYSLCFHIAVIILIPLASHIFRKEKIFIRPQTFELVRMAPSKQVVSKPKKVTAKPKPKKQLSKKSVAVKKNSITKPVPKKKNIQTESVEPEEEVVEEDLDELADLLNEISMPISSISVGKPFKYQWYLNNIRSKVEQNWKPPFNDKKKFVRLVFTILTTGRVSDVKVVGSSGNKAVDNIGVRAVRLAAPFGRLPSGFSGRTLEIEYTLWLSSKL